MNFYIAGMYPNSTYEMLNEIIDPTKHVKNDKGLTFTTGSAAFALSMPNIVTPAQVSADIGESILLHAPMQSNSQSGSPYATDLAGNLLWYYQRPVLYMSHPKPGGNMVLIFGGTTDLTRSGFREIDLAGGTVRETTVARINEQLTAAGFHTINAVHHEARQLSNGNYFLMGMTERVADVQGPSTDIVGDMILVLDSNLQLLWTWDAFDHLDTSRKAVLGETCGQTPAGCVLFLANLANDWTHGSSVTQTADGNLLYSAANQDLVFKIRYANGSGDGSVIWKLGKDGDFTWMSSDPYPWFSHSHDVEFNTDNSAMMSLIDNGDTRVNAFGGNSRGQVLQLDETNRLLTPIINTDLGSYSFALGSAQKLINGNYSFSSGAIQNQRSEISEITSSGTVVYKMQLNNEEYRTFRLADLYSAGW